jgi:hypothetical protein
VCREMHLKEAFSGLYDIACNKNSLVAAHLILENRSFQWMSGSFEQPTIGRWTFWLPSSPYCILSDLIVIGKTSFGGLLLAKVSLMLKLSIRFLLTRRELIFPKKKYLADQGSFKSGFFCLGGNSREDSYFGQSHKEASHCD